MPPASNALLRCWFAFLLGLLFVAGCGGGTATQQAKGQILVGGRNYQVGPKEQLQVIFYPDVPGSTDTYPAEVKADGSFETLGQDRRGIPPGKYRVGITSPFGGGAVAIPQELGDARSPIIREIVIGQDTLEPIDVMKPAE